MELTFHQNIYLNEEILNIFTKVSVIYILTIITLLGEIQDGIHVMDGMVLIGSNDGLLYAFHTKPPAKVKEQAGEGGKR